MTPVSDNAFAIMAVCPETKKYYGITVDSLRRGAYKFVWAFKIDKEKAKREELSHALHADNREKYHQYHQLTFTEEVSKISWQN